MADTNSVGVILDFLRRNRFTRAEAALCSELNYRHDLNGFLQKLTLEEKDLHDTSENDDRQAVLDDQELDFHNNIEISKELIVREIECGTGRNVTGSTSKTTPCVGELKKSNEVVGEGDKNCTFLKSSEDNVLDLCPLKLNSSNGSVEPYQNDGVSSAAFNGTFKALVSQQSKHQTSKALDMANSSTHSGEENTVTADKKSSWPGSSSRAFVVQRNDDMQTKEPRELDLQPRPKNSSFKENFADNPWSRTDENENSSSDLWKDCSIKTVCPFSKGDISTSYDSVCSEKKEDKRTEIIDIRAAMRAQVDEVGRAIYAGKLQGSSELKAIGSLSFPVLPENQKEELPRLPPVKLKSEDKPLAVNWEEKFERIGPASELTVTDSNLLIGSYVDVPVGHEIHSSGMRRVTGGSWLSISQGITEDTSDLISGFATVGNGLSESVNYSNQYWDSDEYDDDDDVGYMRQPIEDEAWFLAHEIDYPSDNEKATGHGSVPDYQDRGPVKEED